MMVMKKSVWIILLAVLVVGCQAPQFGGEQAQDAQQPKGGAEFRSGAQGVVVSFIDNLPPPTLFTNDVMTVMLQVENKGTDKLEPSSGYVVLSGYDQSIFQLQGRYQQFDLLGNSFSFNTSLGNSFSFNTSNWAPLPELEGRTQYLPQGGVETVSFTSTEQLPDLMEQGIDKYEPTLLATACYQYTTKATAQVCLDPNPFAPSARGQKVCRPSTVSLGSQGAPLAVTSVELEPAPGKTRFRINIANVGGGDLFRDDKLDECALQVGLDFTDLDFVKVTDVRVAGQSIIDSCKPLDDSGYVRLVNGKGTIFCSTEVQAASAFLSPLNVELEYGYRTTTAKKVTIRSTG